MSDPKPHALLIEKSDTWAGKVSAELEKIGIKVFRTSRLDRTAMLSARYRPELVVFGPGVGDPDDPACVILQQQGILRTKAVERVRQNLADLVKNSMNGKRPSPAPATATAVKPESQTQSGPDRLCCGVLELDMHSTRVTLQNQTARLTRLQAKLLAWFMRHPGHRFSSEDLLQAVWDPGASGDSSLVRWHIRSLRNALKGVGAGELIVTDGRAGYYLNM